MPHTVGVEDTSNAHVNAILAVEAVSEGLGNALAFIIARAGANRVDMSPANDRLTASVVAVRNYLLILVLRVYFRVAIDH